MDLNKNFSEKPHKFIRFFFVCQYFFMDFKKFIKSSIRREEMGENLGYNAGFLLEVMSKMARCFF
jgi:hypothetical protein